MCIRFDSIAEYDGRTGRQICHNNIAHSTQTRDKSGYDGQSDGELIAHMLGTWKRVSVSEDAASSTRHHLDSRQTTSQTYSSQSLPLHPGPHCWTPVAETTSCHGRTGKWQIEHFPLLHRERGTNCRLS